jgi:hypothetical protein
MPPEKVKPMTQLLPNGKQHFMNNNGQPLAGGRVYHYYVGTNNPKDTFQDAAETIPNTNPIILNSRGEAAIYGTGPYRQVLQTSAGVVIWDQVILDSGAEAVQTVDDFMEEISTDAGAGLVGWRRQPVSETVTNVRLMLDAQAVALWEFADLVTNRPVSVDPKTWDWGPALIAACATGLVVDGNGITYGLANTIVPANVAVLKNCVFLANPSVEGGALLDFTGNGGSLDITVDANSKGLTGVRISGDNWTGAVTVFNIFGAPQAEGGVQSALQLSGSGNEVSVTGRNLVRGLSDNDSIPRLLTTDTSTAGSNNRCPRAVGINVNAGWVTSQPIARCDYLFTDTTTDNTIYAIGGNAYCGEFISQNSADEPFVASGALLRIDSALVVNCNGSASVMNGELDIGTYTIQTTDNSRRFVPVRARSGNASSNVRIGRLRGTIALTEAANGAGVFQFNTGSIGVLEVGQIDLNVRWLADSTKDLTNYVAGHAVRIGMLAINLVDVPGTLTSADKFDFRVPPGLDQPSRISSYVNVSPSGDIRIVNAIQPQMQLGSGFEISSSFGPYLLMANQANPAGRYETGPGAPTVGNWNRGDTIDVKSPFANGVSRYKCVAGGSPGTWRACEWIPARSVTANRPALSDADVGMIFFDNTLGSNGKPIWWNGTAWVDSTGAVV